MTSQRAAVLIGLWIISQFFGQVGALTSTQTGRVAYMAHIGGFTFGAITARLFEKPQQVAETSPL